MDIKPPIQLSIAFINGLEKGYNLRKSETSQAKRNKFSGFLKIIFKRKSQVQSHSDKSPFFDPIFEKQNSGTMARIIPLFPKKAKSNKEAQHATSSGFLSEDLERLRKRIMGDILRSFKSIVRKVLLFPYKQWMTAEQVQEKLNLSAKDLRKLSNSGQLPFEELCGDYYYDSKDVARAQRRQKKPKVR